MYGGLRDGIRTLDMLRASDVHTPAYETRRSSTTIIAHKPNKKTIIKFNCSLFIVFFYYYRRLPREARLRVGSPLHFAKSSRPPDPVRDFISYSSPTPHRPPTCSEPRSGAGSPAGAP